MNRCEIDRALGMTPCVCGDLIELRRANQCSATNYSKPLKSWTLTICGRESFWGPKPVDALRKSLETLLTRGRPHHEHRSRKDRPREVGEGL